VRVAANGLVGRGCTTNANFKTRLGISVSGRAYLK